MTTFGPWTESVKALAVERGSQGAGDLIMAADPVTAVAQGASLYALALEK